MNPHKIFTMEKISDTRFVIKNERIVIKEYDNDISAKADINKLNDLQKAISTIDDEINFLQCSIENELVEKEEKAGERISAIKALNEFYDDIVRDR